MRRFDAVVIGGGILGCFAARNLCRYRLSVLLIEKENDICTGVTKANSAIVYAGYDNRVGSLKAGMTLKGNRDFGRLCQELEVPFSRCGSLMVSFSAEGDEALRKKYRAGLENGVPGIELVSPQQALEMESMLSGDITLALHAPGTGTVNPWKLGIAAWENAAANGCSGLFGAEVLGIVRSGSGYVIRCDKEEINCRCVINCAGLAADRVQELLFPPSVRLFCDGADFIVLDKEAKKPSRVIFHQDAEHGKGITAIPTTEGNLLLGPSRREPGPFPSSTTEEGLAFLRKDAMKLLPGLELEKCIRSFAGLRPNPHRVVLRIGKYVPDGSSIGSFVIERPEAGFISLIGIKTPGLTCANELGSYVARNAAEYLQAEENPGFDGHRRAIGQSYNSPIVCRCEHITKAQIIEAIKRGAKDADGVKRRVGSGMGRCQGGRCNIEIRRLLKEFGNNSNGIL